MSTQIEHTEGECHCPACDLNKAYLEDLKVYEAKKKFQVIDIEGKDGNALENALNRAYADGYDLTAVLKPYAIMRTFPPSPPTTADVIKEVYKRQKITGQFPDVPEDPEDWGPTMGGMQ